MTISTAPILIVVPQTYEATPEGVIKAGWLMSQMDIAGGIVASECAKGRTATIAVKELVFKHSAFIYDVLKIYAKVSKVGKSSVTIELTVMADQKLGAGEKNILIGQAIFVYVAIEKPGIKRLIEI